MEKERKGGDSWNWGWGCGDDVGIYCSVNFVECMRATLVKTLSNGDRV